MSDATKRAAALCASAFNFVFEEDDWVTLGVRQAGTAIYVSGQLANDRVDFPPADLAMLLAYLGRILDAGQRAVLTVAVPYGDGFPTTRDWAWHVPDGTALTANEALLWLPEHSTYEAGKPLPIFGNEPVPVTDIAVTDAVRRLLRDTRPNPA